MRALARIIGAAIAAAALTVSAASAQDYEAQVRGYLEHGMAVHAALGYARDESNADILRPLRLDSPYLWAVYLREGVNYRIYGACDNDCSDLDMEIYGADGELADRDVAIDDVPYVQITPTQSGRHYVRIWLYQCSAEPCYTAARVVSGGTPAPRAEPQVSDEAALDLGDNEYTRVVAAELAAGGQRHLEAGYAQFGEDVIAPVLLASVGHLQRFSLEAGRAYIFQGACDQDCNDVDMEILDSNGERVAFDVELDDRPAVAVTPRTSGDYAVRVWLAQCSVEPCFVGLRAYSHSN